MSPSAIVVGEISIGHRARAEGSQQGRSFDRGFPAVAAREQHARGSVEATVKYSAFFHAVVSRVLVKYHWQQIFAQQRARFASRKFRAIARPVARSGAEATAFPIVHQTRVDGGFSESF